MKEAKPMIAVFVWMIAMIAYLLLPYAAQSATETRQEQPPAPVIVHGHIEIPNATQGNFEAIESKAYQFGEVAEVITPEPTIEEIVHAEATRVGIEPGIVMAIIETESGCF